MPFPLRSALLALCVMGLSACRATPTTAVLPGGATGSQLLRVYDRKASRWITFDAMTRELSKADFVFFGEQHDDPVTHSIEAATLAAIGEQRGGVVLALEMFERDVQPLLDGFVAGTTTEAAFLAGSRPWDRYAIDYRPMIELARVRGWPIVASNIPRRIASGVSRRGLAHLDTLAPAERAFAATVNQCPRDRYFERFAGAMGSHGASGPTTAADAEAARAMTFRFYEAQCVKDEAMGEAVAAAWTRHGRRLPVFHVDGAFHSDFGDGTAERARRRAPDARMRIVTAIPVPSLADADPAPHAEKADYLVFTLRK